MNSYDLDQVLLLVDVEWRSAKMQLICEYSNRPKIHLLVVAFSLQQFGGQVQRSAAKSSPQFLLLVDCPPEVA